MKNFNKLNATVQQKIQGAAALERKLSHGYNRLLPNWQPLKEGNELMKPFWLLSNRHDTFWKTEMANKIIK